MTLTIQDLLRLSRIGDELRRNDPEMAGRLPRMNGRLPRVDGRLRSWRAASCGVLTVSAVLAFFGLAISNLAAYAAGGILLMIIYPALLGFARSERSKHSGSEGDHRFGA
jgi:Protein of unknown function (DUF3040)